MQSDGARLSQVRCHTARDGHLYRKFSWGSRRSLYDDPRAKGVDIRSEITAYYKYALPPSSLGPPPTSMESVNPAEFSPNPFFLGNCGKSVKTGSGGTLVGSPLYFGTVAGVPNRRWRANFVLSRKLKAAG